MDYPNPDFVRALSRAVIEESHLRDRRISDLRKAIEGGVYRISAEALAESLMRSMLP